MSTLTDGGSVQGAQIISAVGPEHFHWGLRYTLAELNEVSSKAEGLSLHELPCWSDAYKKQSKQQVCFSCINSKSFSVTSFCRLCMCVDVYFYLMMMTETKEHFISEIYHLLQVSAGCACVWTCTFIYLCFSQWWLKQKNILLVRFTICYNKNTPQCTASLNPQGSS